MDVLTKLQDTVKDEKPKPNPNPQKPAPQPVVLETAVQKLFVTFLHDLQNELRVPSLNQMFDFLAYEQNAAVRGHELEQWEELCWMLRLPLFCVMRSIGIVRMDRDDFSLGLFHLITSPMNRSYFVRMCAHLYTDVQIDTARVYRTKITLVEHERSKEECVEYFKLAELTLGPTQPARDNLPWAVERKILVATHHVLSKHTRMMINCCGFPHTQTEAQGSENAFTSSQMQLPRASMLPVFDQLMVAYHLAAITYARDESLFHRRHLSRFVINRRNNIYNQLLTRAESYGSSA